MKHFHSIVSPTWIWGLSVVVLLCVSGWANVCRACFNPRLQDESPWSVSLETALKESAVSGKPILVKFEAEWCPPCHALDKEFAKPAFQAIQSAAILVKIDVDKQPELAREFAVQSIPKVLLLDSNQEIVAEKTGFVEIDEWVDWMKDAVEDTEFEMPDELVSNDPPTRTETKELIKNLASQDAAMRQITMERLSAFPAKTRDAIVDSLIEDPKLGQQLSILEILGRWNAPIEGLDPWVKTSFTPERLQLLEKWKTTPLEDLQTELAELTPADLELAQTEIDALLDARNLRAGLARLTRYGEKLLPTVYERLKNSQSDEATTRLTALRYWLTASNELRLGWSSGLVELASLDLDSRRNAAQALIQRATINDQPLLLELFADSDPLVRELSLKGLQQIGAKETDATLARLLNDPDPNVRAAVLKQFADSEATQMSDEVAKYLESETDGDLIVHALRFLKTTSGDESIKAVLRFADHESWQVRAEVAEALGKFEASDLSAELMVEKGEAVMKLLEDPDGFVVSRAVQSLPDRKSKKMYQNLTDIALRKPDIAGAIITAIAESGYSSFGSDSVSAVPYLKQFISHEDPLVRAAGLKGISSKYPDALDDQELVDLLKDENQDVRVAAIQAFYQRLESFQGGRHRHSSNGIGVIYDVEYEPMDEMTLSGSIGSSILNLLGLSGSRPRPVRPTILDEPQVESVPSPSSSSEPSPLNPDEISNDFQADSDKSPVRPAETSTEKELKLPALAQEEWLAKWLAGKEDIEMEQSIEQIKVLSRSDEHREKIPALACLIALGDQGAALNEFLSLAQESTENWALVDSLLTWLPPEKRMELFTDLLGSAKSDERSASLFHAFTKIRNPKTALMVWESSTNTSTRPEILYEALLAASFGDSVSSYSPLQSDSVDPNLVELAKQQAVQFSESPNPTTQKLVLMMLQKIDLAAAKELATTWAKSADDLEVQDLAFRIMLRPNVAKDFDPYGFSSVKVDRSHGVQWLDSEESWKYKTTLRYLAFGEETLNVSENSDDEFRISSSVYFGSSSSSDDVKVRIPKPPKGMTLAQVARTDPTMDPETLALATYFRSLFDAETDLTPLVTYWQAHKTDEEYSQLLYRAVASTNNDELIPLVAEIYELHKDSYRSDAADLYWTIRVMDGSNAIQLRKKIRDEIGMSQLN